MTDRSELRVIVSLCKSGSTALIHSLAHADGVSCYMQTVKSGQRTHGTPDYGIYRQHHEGTALGKETIGPRTLADCTLAVFPDDAAIRATRPVFLLRDPRDTWATWSRAGWGSLERFLTAYEHLLNLYDRAQALGVGTVFRYEAFGEDVERAFRELSAALGIGFTPDMIDWRLRFPDETPVIWRADVQADVDRGLSDSARRATGFRYRRSPQSITPAARAAIEARVGRRYRQLVSRPQVIGSACPAADSA
ncbi:hypothetical protein [Elongatibacter sediminis]|uniref:Sulfotransferase domain-containing protein n=1 Tax=Elongatibacter sediminis TaxID=3119006 RepID=A0AAW9RA87_9GAMM